VGHAVGFDYAGAFKVERVILKVGEEADAAAEEDGDEVEVDQIEKARSQVLLCHACGADGDVTVAGDGARLLESAFDAVGHDGAFRTGAHMTVGWIMSEQEERSTGRVAAAPAVGYVKRAPAGDDRPAAKHFAGDRPAARWWSETVVAGRTDALVAGGPPFEQPASAVPERVGRAVVRPGENPSSETESSTTTSPIFLPPVSTILSSPPSQRWPS